ncbi:MAG: hypothetical protein RL220_121 [Bacteroidota bacterium]
MILTFLGTGTSQGVPVIACQCPVCLSADQRDKRLRTSVMISNHAHNVVIDTGPDFRQQMLNHDVRHLSGVVFTHEHKDHIAGLDDVRAFNFFSGKKMSLFCTDKVEQALRREFYYAFSQDKYPGVPELDFENIHEASFSVGDIDFIPLPVKHMHMDVLGFRMGNLAYITDANYIPDSTYERLKGCKILILNALRKEKHPSHFTLEEAIEIARRIGPERTFLTHISHQLGTHADISDELPAGVELAFDGLQISF